MATPVFETYSLNRGAQMTLVRDFISPSEQRGLMTRLVDSLDFEQRQIQLFGRMLLQPRLIAWAGEVPYRYSGDTLHPRTIPPALTSVFKQVNETLHQLAPHAPSFNHVLLNLYRDGQDSMGAHSDDERELGPSPFIASLSLGQERSFRVRLKKKFQLERPEEHSASKNFLRTTTDAKNSHKIRLSSGSFLLMHAPMQRFFQHEVPKEKGVTGARLSLTFRSIQRATP